MMARYDHIDFAPPNGVRDACARGVALHADGVTGDGIEPETVEWARKLARGAKVSPSKARKMARFFGRNQRFADEPKDSPAWASWLLWGGSAGDAWSEKLVTQMDAADEATKTTESPAEAPAVAADLNAPTPLVSASETPRDASPAVLSCADTSPVVTMRGEGAAITCRDANVGQKTWVQVARYGTFEGHPQGPFRFDAQTFAEIVRNFRSTQNQHVQVDFEHASELHPENVATEGVPALAWVVDLDDRGDAGLWGLFLWVNPLAVEYVRANQYRYVSPAVQFGAIDKVTGNPIGARLTSVALTNHPFLDGMAPVTASERATLDASKTAAPTTSTTARFGVTPSDVHIPALPGATTTTKAKKMDPTESPDGGAAEMADLKGAKDALVKLQREHAMLGDKYMAMCKAMREMADVSPETSEDEALAKIAGLIEKMKAAQKAEAEQMADRAIAGHGLSEKARAKLVAHAMRDAADFVDTYPKAVKVEAPAAPAQMSDRTPPAQRPAVDPQTRALFSTQVATGNSTPAPIATGDGTVADVSRAREELAAALLRDGKAKGYAQAVNMADDMMSAETRKRAVAPFAH